MNLLYLRKGISVKAHLEEQNKLKDNCIFKIPPHRGWWIMKSIKLGCTAQLTGDLTGWRVSFLGSSLCLNLFKVVQLTRLFHVVRLVWTSSRQLSLSEKVIWSSYSLLTIGLRREEPSKSSQFQGLSEAFEFFLSLMNIPCNLECFISPWNILGLHNHFSMIKI